MSSFLKNYRRTGQLLVITAAGDAHRGEFPPPLVYWARDVHPYSSHFSRQMHISLTLPLSVSLLCVRVHFRVTYALEIEKKFDCINRLFALL